MLVARLDISPIVATLATSESLSGVARMLSKGSALPVPSAEQMVAHDTVLDRLDVATAGRIVARAHVTAALTADISADRSSNL